MVLPFTAVPGSNVLDVDDDGDGPQAAIVFLSFAVVTSVLVANILAPELVGQSLWGPLNYIEPPEDAGVVLY